MIFLIRYIIILAFSLNVFISLFIYMTYILNELNKKLK